MMRVTTIFFCLLLAGAAAGRYRAEVAVRGVEERLDALENAAAEERGKIQVLRNEVAYLESPERLAALARENDLALAPMRGEQILAAEAFSAQYGDGVVGSGAPEAPEPAPARRDEAPAMAEERTGPARGPTPALDDSLIMHALAMAEIESSAR